MLMATAVALERGQEPKLVLSAFEEWLRLKIDFNKRELFCFGDIQGFIIGLIDSFSIPMSLGKNVL
jgi:hypothetical protein